MSMGPLAQGTLLQKYLVFQKPTNNSTRSWFDKSDSVGTLDEIGAHHERVCPFALSHFGKLRACPEFIEGTGLSKGVSRLFQK